MERFLRKCPDPNENGCVLWANKTTPDCYPRFWTGERQVAGHRWIYEQTHGPIRAGYQIDHLCSVRRCVAIAHLEMVTPQENILRSFDRRGITCWARRKGVYYAPLGTKAQS